MFTNQHKPTNRGGPCRGCFFFFYVPCWSVFFFVKLMDTVVLSCKRLLQMGIHTKKQHKRHGESKIGYVWGFVVSSQQTEVGVNGSASSAPLWPRLRSPVRSQASKPSWRVWVQALASSFFEWGEFLVRGQHPKLWSSVFEDHFPRKPYG